MLCVHVSECAPTALLRRLRWTTLQYLIACGEGEVKRETREDIYRDGLNGCDVVKKGEEVNEWMTEWVRKCEWMSEKEWKRMSEWVRERWMSEWMNEWMNDRMDGLMDGRVNEWVHDRLPVQCACAPSRVLGVPTHRRACTERGKDVVALHSNVVALGLL